MCHGLDHEHEFIQIYLDFISFYMILFHFIIVDISLSPVYSIYDDYMHVPHYVTIATALICNTGDVMLTSFASWTLLIPSSCDYISSSFQNILVVTVFTCKCTFWEYIRESLRALSLRTRPPVFTTLYPA